MTSIDTTLTKLVGGDLERLDPPQQVAARALNEFIDWCERNAIFIEQGRAHGFRLAVSPAVKDAIALSVDRELANRINGSILDLPK